MPPDTQIETIIRNSRWICRIEGCGKTFKRENDLDSHEFRHTGIKKHFCTNDGCDKKYSTLKHLKRHIQTIHSAHKSIQNSVCCEISTCQKQFSTKSVMLRHVRDVHGNSKVYSCSHCAQTFTQKLKLKRHEVNSHSVKYPYNCSKCFKGFYSQCQCDQHEITCKVYCCQEQYCSKQFDKWTTFLQHCRNFQHSQKNSKVNHKDISEQKKTLKSPKEKGSRDFKYKCKVDGCVKSFKRLEQLDRHQFYHTGVKKHKCPISDCDKSYLILSHLKRHIRCAHENTQPRPKNVSCIVENCGKLFTSSSNMQRHIREVHENPKIYPCSHCGEKFTQKLKLKRHDVMKHSSEYPYRCTKCSKGFFNQWQLDQHKTCRLYSCPDCSTQFDKWSTYLSHCKENQHGRKKHKCEQCSQVYSRPSELLNHIDKKHRTDESKTVFKCTEQNCQRTYNYERNLKQHISIVHEGNLLECNMQGCERSFSSSQNLAQHIKRHHEHKETQNVPRKKAKGMRRKRKDAGKPVMSILAKLSGISVDKKVDRLLWERDPRALENISAKLFAELNVDDSFREELDPLQLHPIESSKKDENYDTNNELDYLISAVLDEEQ